MSTFSTVNLDNQSVQRIIQTSLTCFGRRGFAATSLNDIAREAGVSKSLLHYHFDSKEHLFLESQLTLLRTLLAQLKAVTVGDKRGVLNFNVALGQVMDFVETNLDQICVVLTFRNVAHEHPEVQVHLDRFNVELNELVITAIHNTLGPHVERLVLPPKRLARLLVTVFNGLIVDLAFASSAQARELVRQTFDDVRAVFPAAILREVS